MKLIRGIQAIPAFKHGTVVTIGNFDGVHAGHRALLLQLKEKAVFLGLPAVVVLFEPQPYEFLSPEKAPPRLSSLREKCHFLNELAIDFVFCVRFNIAFSALSPDEFLEKIIFSTLNAQYLLVGEDFCFGRNRSGNIETLSLLCDRAHSQLAVFSPFILAGERVSSTRIRALLRDAHFSETMACLNHPYILIGRVIHGQGLGRQLGIPTANIGRSTKLGFPFSGVFCVKVKRQTGEWLNGVANVGIRPTVSGHKKILEVHFIDTSCDVYGERLCLYFLHKLRDEIKFDSVEKLVAQIHMDIAAAKAYVQAGHFVCEDESTYYYL